MPYFDFECQNCQNKFESLVRNDEELKEVKCDKCESLDVKKLPGFMSIYSISGNNNSSTPTKRHRRLDGSS